MRHRELLTLAFLATGWIGAPSLSAAAQACAPRSASTAGSSVGALPLYFVENRGLYADAVRYSIQGADKTLFFTDDGVTIAFRSKRRGWTVKLDFVGARHDARPEGLDRQAAVFSYFKGPAKDWKAGLATFSRVAYRDLWPGIDLVYNGNLNQLKYEFVVAPGADPSKIRLRYRGATSVVLADSGALRVETPEGSFEDAPPAAWQEIEGRRVPVAMAYELGASRGDTVEFGFRTGDYDRTLPLVLDPAVIVYCGYIGGTGRENARAVAVDAAGCVYLTGNTTSNESTGRFPVTVGPDVTYNEVGADADAWVAKLDPSGRHLLYCGYIGGAAWDYGLAVAVDAAGCAYVTGFTRSDSTSFPVTPGAWDTSYNGGYDDVFVAKVSASGRSLDYCTYLGGASYEDGRGIAVDSIGRAIVTGWTDSDERSFPVNRGPGLTYRGNCDVFVACVAKDGASLDYCGYIGGTGEDCKGAPNVPVAVDARGNAYVAGWTASDENSGFPVKVGPDVSHNGGWDVFVAKVSPLGSLAYCGYIGGAAWDSASTGGHGIAVDANGSAYVVSTTASDEKSLPVLVGPDPTFNGGGTDVFVAKVTPSGSTLQYCGYVGGDQSDLAWGVAVDRAGGAVLCGTTSGGNGFPLKEGPDLTYNGGGDAFIARVDATGTNLTFCGYVGGAHTDQAYGVAVDAAGNAYLAGGTKSDAGSFPVLGGPSTTFMGLKDAFIAKIALLDDLVATGSPRPGNTVVLSLDAMDASGLPYQLGSSLGSGPVPIDTRQVGLSADILLVASVAGYWPAIFQGYAGRLDSQGKASAAIHLPNDSKLVGTDLHTAFVTLDPSWPSGIRSISRTCSIRIVR